MLADGVVELPQALFVQHHQSDAGYRFSHGVDAEQRVHCHRGLIVDSRQASGFKRRNLAIASQEPDHAGNVLIGNDLRHGGV